MAKKVARLPSVLSIQRGLNVSDGLMYSIIAGSDVNRPVQVVRHGIRGVLGDVNAHKAGDKAATSNIQITETAKLAPDAEGLLVCFSVRPIELVDSVFACNDKGFSSDLVTRFIEKTYHSAELAEVCRRYAHNILNGSWLWRNRVLGKATITALFDGRKIETDAIHGREFEEHPDTRKLGDFIRDCMIGEAMAEAVVEVEARITGKGLRAMEVYPSQNMVTTKPKGFARPLYKVNPITPAELYRLMNPKGGPEAVADTIVMGEAALRDQKIGNAIRSIDTWHGDDKAGAIAVEPNGASLRDNAFYRTGDNSGYAILDDLNGLIAEAEKLSAGNELNERVMYALSLIIRGAVLSSDKDKKEKQPAPKQEAA